MTQTFIKILNGTTLVELATLYDLEDPYIYEQVNDKYTFDFSCYPQVGVEYLAKDNIIVVDGDYFRIRRKGINRGGNSVITVSCEHVSYELNTKQDSIAEVTYTGTANEILTEMLTANNTRFEVLTVDVTGTFEFKTTTGPLRSRIIEFAKFIGAEISYLRFGVSILARRGHDNNVVLGTGKNVLELDEITEIAEDGTEKVSYEISFIDLSKVKDSNGNPIEQYEVHLGDTIYIEDGELGYIEPQRAVSVGYNPFRKELPTVELGNIIKDISQTITSVQTTANGGGNKEVSDLVVGATSFTVTYADNRTTTYNYTVDANGMITSITKVLT